MSESDTGTVRVPLSLQLDFLRMMDDGSEGGPFGPRYTLAAGWRVRGPIDLDALRAALDDVVERHEALRTRIVLDDGEPYQEICPPASPDLDVRDLTAGAAGREVRTEEFINEVEESVSIGPTTPRLRAVLGRFDPEDAVLVFVAHHTIVDGWGLQVVFRDLVRCYTARGAGETPDLPPAPQYREYVAWQRRQAGTPATARARAFWREHLDGARVTPVPTDRPRTHDGYVTGWHRFMLEDEFRTATLDLARETRSSPFMVLLAAFLVVLRERTGETDLVVPTLTAGRPATWMLDVVGVFYNFTPLRTDIGGCTTFREVVARVRTACLKTYPNELTFPEVISEAPELMTAVAVPEAAPVAFQVIQHGVEAEPAAGVRFEAVRRRVVSTPVGSQIPDGILAELDLHPEGGMFGKVAYTKHMFDESTVVGLMSDLRAVLVDVVIGREQAA
ncbi:condensation domain-containing protein [Amycolatopsis sp. NPDC098790]|uniref:condensation domain-containing protein n=1 Tax=Amycolatopsis sp. NPDC098790 TaxID=3363939 RepID=UPI0038173B3B